MKNSSKILILAIFLVFICCVSAASAAENDNVTASGDELAVEEISADDVIDKQDTLASQEVDVDEKLTQAESSDILSSDEGNVIYVNQNQTGDGEGSLENPYKNLDLACQKANQDPKDSITINIYAGTYYMGNNLEFNVNNLYVCGVDGNVVIKNMYNDKNLDTKESFRLTSSNGNITFSNVIFDATEYTVSPFIRTTKTNFFMPFYGDANLVTFINCSFLNFTMPIEFDNHNLYSSKFINCYINVDTTYAVLFYNKNYVQYSDNVYPTFEYCNFNLKNIKGIADIHLPCNIYVNNSWFGQNTLPNYISNPSGVTKDPGGQVVTDWSVPINRYAVFSVSENYLGNNQWEIIGKLTWNGTNDQDGMENFQPMIVELKSTTGEIASTATLVNGTFRTIYTSSASTHHIETKLDSEDNQELDFTLVNINVTAPAIKYGEDQNITINFSQPINSTVSITVNNRTYSVKVNESDSVTYTINDVNLTKGEYNVDITLNDAEKHIYGSNSTTLSVSKVNVYTFNPIVPSEAKVGDAVNVTVELPDDVTGNVTVYVNNKPITQQASKNTVISISGLIIGNNEIIVFYEGNDKYENITSNKQYITVDKESDYSFDVDLPENVKVGDDVNIIIELPTDVNGTATVYVGTQDGTIVPVNTSSTTVPISGLVAGNNTIKVVFSDNKYAEKTVTKNLTVEKVPVEIKNDTIVVNTPTGNAAPTLSFNLPNATGNLTVTVKGKTYTKELVNGTATVTITDLPAGTYDATVTYSGDDKFDSITTTTKITVNEAKKQDQKTDSKTKKVTKVATKIVAKNKKFKAKTKVKKYTITLKAGKKPVKKVQVTIKIGKKTFKAKTNNKGKATFKIKKLTKKAKYKATIKFKGNKNYKATSKKVKITIK